MRQILKSDQSIIVVNGYVYPANQREIIAQLDIEQGYLCAYTEEKFTPGYARDVEHFDPSVKNTHADGYYNWYSASARVNRRKRGTARWNKCQPILSPTNVNLEARLIYNAGYYIPSDPNDFECLNLIEFLLLNQFGLPDARKAYIGKLQFLLQEFNNDLNRLTNFLQTYPEEIQYRRAIEAEIGIRL